jgi:hypothetical protein
MGSTRSIAHGSHSCVMILAIDQHTIHQRQRTHQGFLCHRQQILEIVRDFAYRELQSGVLLVLELRYFAARFSN